MKLTYKAGERDAGRRVYHVLRRDLRLSETAVKRLKLSGGIRVNGQLVFTDHRLSPGERLEADLASAEREPEFPPERGELAVLYEDEGLLAVDKPAGLLTHPSRSRFTGTLANLAAGYLLAREGSAAVHPVNRLDRDTSGVVLFAKNAHLQELTAQSLRDTGEKVYRAVLFGALPEERGVIDAPILRAEPGAMRRVVSESGKPAVTRYETLARGEALGQPVTETRLHLETGRTHQIRVHCAYLGAPVLGDRLYGTAASVALADELGLIAHLLHAERLTFAHPLTGETLTIAAPPRAEMSRIFEIEET